MPLLQKGVEEELCRTRVVNENIRSHSLNPNICPKLAAKFPHLVRYRSGGNAGVGLSPDSGHGEETTEA